MAKIQIRRSETEWPGEVKNADLTGLKICLLFEADKSDPLNTSRVVGLRVGKNLLIRGSEDGVPPTSNPYSAAYWQSEQAVAALVRAVIDNYAEIRDALSEAAD